MRRPYVDDELGWLDAENPTEGAEVFFDNTRDLPDPNKYAVGHTAWSEDGNYWAYSVSKGGSDWVTIKVRDANTLEDLSDEL